MKLTADTPIGRKRSGLMCLPAGRLYWRDAKPEGRRLERQIAEGMREAGIAVTIRTDDDVDSAVRTPFRMTVALTDIAVQACRPWRGIRLGAKARFGMEGRTSTVWRVFDQRAHALVLKAHVCTDFRFSGETGELSILVGRAIADASGLIAPVLGGDLSKRQDLIVGCSAEDRGRQRND